MALSFDYAARHLIPVWRSFSEARKSPELDSSGRRQHHVPNIGLLLTDWAESPSLVLASEIVSAGTTTGRKDFVEYAEAQDFLERHITPSAALDLVLHKSTTLTAVSTGNANKSLSAQYDLLLEDLTVDTIERLWERISRKSMWSRLHQVKQAAYRQLTNPITWVDTALLYTIQGQFAKAERCMRIALSIDPNNRFVLRAATTLFVHFGDTVQAIHYLRKSARTKYDPWLISAHIAASSSVGRFSPFLKEGRAMLSDTQVAPVNITELASSVATEEYQSGAVKKSRNYFQQALQRPNENTLAQLEWISLADHRFPFNPAGYRRFVPHPFEADALECWQRGRWEPAVLNAVKWFLESPYNRQSVTLCVYLLTTLFEKYGEAITFCEMGLQIHQNDPALLNNLVYCHAMLGTQHGIKEVVRKFKAVDESSLNMPNQIAHLATLGLLLFREGAVSEGREKYEEALRIANREKDEVRANVALINLAREILLADEPDKADYMARVAKIQEKTKIAYIILLCKRFFEQFNDQKANPETRLHDVR